MWEGVCEGEEEGSVNERIEFIVVLFDLVEKTADCEHLCACLLKQRF